MKSHVWSWSFTTNKNFLIFHLYCNIISSWKEKTTCLTIHCLRSKCSSNQKYFPSTKLLLKSGIELTDSNLDKSILIRYNSLTLSSIMISTHLIIFGWPNRGSLTKFNKTSLFEQSKLPSNEWIIIRVHFCCDKWSTVINVHSEFLYTLATYWREVFCPECWLTKWRNQLFG